MIKEFFLGMVRKPHLPKRIVLCVIAVCMMGVCVSWLNLLAWGTDPCSVMNFAISAKLGMTFGNWQALLNVLLFVIVIIKGRRNIGFGTVFNMFLVGYACDAMTWVRLRLWPDFVFTGWPMKIISCIVILFLFVFFVAVYMSVDLGTAPYDAIPFIIASAQHVLSFRIVRIIWDVCITIIGFAFGGTVGIVTILMAFTIGPMAAFVQKKIQRFIT